MGLNRIKEVPNSTEVWWKMTENRTGFKVSPSCKLPIKFSKFNPQFFQVCVPMTLI